MTTKSLVFIPESLTKKNQIITLNHPNYEENNSDITLLLSDGSDNDEQKVYWIQQNKFGKSQEGSNLTVKSTFYFKTHELQKGGIINNDSIYFSTDYDLAFSLLSHFYKTHKMDFISKDFESKFETLNDLHIGLFESNNNWKYINKNLLKKSLMKLCHSIEEDLGGDTMEVFFKMTDVKLLEFFEMKIEKIAKDFPQRLLQKINNMYPALSIQSERIQEQAKYFYSLQLMASLVPFKVYEYVNAKFRTSLYPDFVNYIEVDYKKTIEQNQQEELLLKSAKSLNQGLQSNVPHESGSTKKKVKTKVVPKSKGLDSFFKVKK
ncbi:Ribonuclease H2 subunit B [Hanseniaspora opuntiae]|uniref:Ribonuclease H2 subunit B n=1 Tax=Hanseniaspora opuntiae TaxID=211096 RepID=A0A1E5RLX7_9ASCO|nr:Ribonuclease H2 subunit B [Hanseniaspora opuntiae]